MMRILVTGGCGFIGKRNSLRLRKEGVDVRILDALSPQVHGFEPDLAWIEKNGIELLKGSVCDPVACQEALEETEVVVHLAAETGTGQSMYELRKYIDTNVGGTATLLEACVRQGVKKVVLSSSRAVYGEGSWRCQGCGRVHPRMRAFGDIVPEKWNPLCPNCNKHVVELLPTLEDEILMPVSVYGVTKMAQEQLVQLVQASSQMDCFVLRFFNVYGPGQSLSNPYTGVLGVFVNRARLGKPLDLYEDGHILRDFVYVDDAIDAIVSAIGVDSSGVCNIGSGTVVPIAELAQRIVTLCSSSSETPVTGKTRIGDVRGLVADLGRAHEMLGWQPRTPLDQGLQRFVEWALSSPFEDKYEQSLEELKMRGVYH